MDRARTTALTLMRNKRINRALNSRALDLLILLHLLGKDADTHVAGEGTGAGVGTVGAFGAGDLLAVGEGAVVVYWGLLTNREDAGGALW
jgi:hypothetical protein